MRERQVDTTCFDKEQREHSQNTSNRNADCRAKAGCEARLLHLKLLGGHVRLVESQTLCNRLDVLRGTQKIRETFGLAGYIGAVFRGRIADIDLPILTDPIPTPATSEIRLPTAAEAMVVMPRASPSLTSIVSPGRDGRKCQASDEMGSEISEMGSEISSYIRFGKREMEGYRRQAGGAAN